MSLILWRYLEHQSRMKHTLPLWHLASEQYFNILASLVNCAFVESLFISAAKWLQLYPTLCDAMGRSPPGSSVRGTVQPRILEWVAMPSFSQPRDRTLVSRVSCGFFTTSATWEDPFISLSLKESLWYENGIHSIPSETERLGWVQGKALGNWQMLSLWIVTAAHGGGFFRIITIVLFFSSSSCSMNIIIIITLGIKKFRVKEVEGESSCWVMDESYVNWRARTLWYHPVRIYVDPLFRCQVTPVYLDHIRMLFELLPLLHFNILWQRTSSAYKPSHWKLLRKWKFYCQEAWPEPNTWLRASPRELSLKTVIHRNEQCKNITWPLVKGSGTSENESVATNSLMLEYVRTISLILQN